MQVADKPQRVFFVTRTKNSVIKSKISTFCHLKDMFIKNFKQRNEWNSSILEWNHFRRSLKNNLQIITLGTQQAPYIMCTVDTSEKYSHVTAHHNWAMFQYKSPSNFQGFNHVIFIITTEC